MFASVDVANIDVIVMYDVVYVSCILILFYDDDYDVDAFVIVVADDAAEVVVDSVCGFHAYAIVYKHVLC